MILQIQKGILAPEAADITFPTTLDKVQAEMRGLEESGKCYGTVDSVIGKGSARVLDGRVRVDDLNTEAGIRSLNQLANVIDNMSGEKLEFLSGALALERAANLNDVLHVVDGLDQYELFSQIMTDDDLGHFLVDTSSITGKFSFPEEVRPYLDYAKIGAEQRKVLGGIYTPKGFIKRGKEAPAQEKSPCAMLLTLTAGEHNYPLVLPASEKQLDHAKRALGLEDFSQAVIASTEYTAPFLNRLIPTDCITVEYANEMAHCLQRLKKDGEIMKYCAALEAEEPSTFTEALDMAIDLDDYELISGSEREYAHEALRRMGANDEVLEAIEGHTDFDRLGSDMMEEDGVRQTGFGLVRRLSQPFPTEPEIGQAMM